MLWQMQSAHFSVRCFSLDVAGRLPCIVNVTSHQKKVVAHSLSQIRLGKKVTNYHSDQLGSRSDKSKVPKFTFRVGLLRSNERKRNTEVKGNVAVCSSRQDQCSLSGKVCGPHTVTLSFAFSSATPLL